MFPNLSKAIYIANKVYIPANFVEIWYTNSRQHVCYRLRLVVFHLHLLVATGFPRCTL